MVSNNEKANDITYKYYGKLGNWKNNCKNYLASLKQGTSIVPNGVYMLHTCFSLSALNSDMWVLDTASGSHICNSLQRLHNIRGLKRGDLELFDASEKSISIEVVETCMLYLPLDKILELEECYFILKIIRNIISVSLLLKQGYEIKLIDNGCSILFLMNSMVVVY